jgi:NAD(P)-dependent dehydrogenase (short-subunit alcohol dehydrogenase family)
VRDDPEGGRHRRSPARLIWRTKKVRGEPHRPCGQELLGGAVSLLVNSASTFHDDTALTHSREDWDAHMEPNLRAPIHLAQLTRFRPAGW